MEEYNGITWDPEDEESCTKAIKKLLDSGVGIYEIAELNFGDVIVDEVFIEYGVYDDVSKYV